MLVRDFIAWLQTQDQDAIVHVLVQQRPPAYQSFGDCDAVPFTPELADYTDFRANPFAKGTEHENDRDLILGKKD